MADLQLSQATLSDYLAEVGNRSGFLPGEMDCCTFMADWLVRLGLSDVMADRRGTYRSVREFRRMLKSEGGLLAACERRFSHAGLVRTETPQPGDVAVVRMPYAVRGGRVLTRPTGAIALTARHLVTLGRRHLFVASTLPTERTWTRA